MAELQHLKFHNSLNNLVELGSESAVYFQYVWIFLLS